MACLSALVLLAPSSGTCAPRYKQNTVVDFDGATVEGKSRKPYSAYVSERALAGSPDLASWQVNFLENMRLSRRQWEKVQ